MNCFQVYKNEKNHSREQMTKDHLQASSLISCIKWAQKKKEASRHKS